MLRISIVMLCLLISDFVYAEPQGNLFEGESVSNKEIELTKIILAKQRNDEVFKSMGLSAHDKKEFLGVYNKYRDDMKPILDKLTKLIVDYAGTHVKNNLTDKQAIEFVKTFLDLKTKKTALRIKYVDIFSEKISPKHVARFIQIENKLDAVINYDLARGVPLVSVK